MCDGFTMVGFFVRRGGVDVLWWLSLEEGDEVK